MQIEFPMSDFGVPFEKDYEVSGAQFTIRVLKMGVDTLGPVWLFQLIVKGNQIEGGPYHPGYERELTDENVANHLASFWGHTQMVQDAWQLAGSSEWELDQIVEKCAQWMHTYLMHEDREHTDYDIQLKAIGETGWCVILRPNYIPNRLLEFIKNTDSEEVEVHSYIEDNELSIRL